MRIRKFVHLLVTGNSERVVPAGVEERQFTVLEIGDDHIRDAEYFSAIEQEMDNGGREALLHYLLNFDLSTVNLREIPKTAALLDQKIPSLTLEQGWWLDLLKTGRLPETGETRGRQCHLIAFLRWLNTERHLLT
jgi:hypothetical protein